MLFHVTAASSYKVCKKEAIVFFFVRLLLRWLCFFRTKQQLDKSFHTEFYFFNTLLPKCFIMRFHKKAASKVCIKNVIVFILGFVSQMVPYTFS